MRAGGSPTNLPNGTLSAGPVVVFGPEGQTFARPITITLPTVRKASGVYTRPLGNGPWTPVPDVHYDATKRMVVAQAMHFSMYGTVASVTDYPATGYLLSVRVPNASNPKAHVYKCLATCSATLIRLLLTEPEMPVNNNIAVLPAHCLSLASNPEDLAIGFGDVCDGQDGNGEATVDVTCQDEGTSTADTSHRSSVYRVRNHWILQYYDPTSDPPGQDIALVALDRSVPDRPPAHYFDSATTGAIDLPTIGDCSSVFGIGYGPDETGKKNARRFFPQCFRGAVHQSALLTTSTGGQNGQFCATDVGGSLYYYGIGGESLLGLMLAVRRLGAPTNPYSGQVPPFCDANPLDQAISVLLDDFAGPIEAAVTSLRKQPYTPCY